MANPTTASVDRDLLREQQRQARQFREASQLPYFPEPKKVAPSVDDALCHQIKQTLGEYESMRETIISNSKNLIGIARASSGPHDQQAQKAAPPAPPNGVRKNAPQPSLSSSAFLPQAVKGSCPDDVSGGHNRRDKPKHRIRVNGHGTSQHPPPPQPPQPPPVNHPPNGAILQNGMGKGRKAANLQPVIVETVRKSKAQSADQCEQLDSILKEMKAPAPLTGIPTPNKEGTVFPFPGPGTPILSKEKEMKDKGRMVAVVHPHVEDPPSPATPNNRDTLIDDLEISEESDNESVSDLKKTVADHRKVISSPSGSSDSEDSTSGSDSDDGSCSESSSLSPSRPESPKDPPSWNLSEFMVPVAQPLPPLPSSSSSCSSSSSNQPPEIISSPPRVALAESPPSKPRKPFGSQFAPEPISAKVERRLKSPREPSPAPKCAPRTSATPATLLHNGFVKKERRKAPVHDAPSNAAPRRRTAPEASSCDTKRKKSLNLFGPILAPSPSPTPTPPTRVYKSKEFVYDSSSSSRSPSPSPRPSPSVRDESESECIVDVVGTPSPVKMAPDGARRLFPLSPKTKLLSPMLLSPTPLPKVSARIPALPRSPTTLVVRLDLTLIERVPAYPPLESDSDPKADTVPVAGRNRQAQPSGPRSTGTPLKQASDEELVPLPPPAPERCKGPCTPPTPYPDNFKSTTSSSSSSSLKRKSAVDEKEKPEGKRPKLACVQPDSHKKPKHRTKDPDVKPSKERKKKAKSSNEETQAPSSASSSERRVTSSTLDAAPVPSKSRTKNEEGKMKRKKNAEDGTTIRANREHKILEKAPEQVAVKKEPADANPKSIVNPFVTSTPTVVSTAVVAATSRSKQRNGETAPKRRKREARPPAQPPGPEPPKKASDSPVRNTNHDRQGSSASTSGTCSVPVGSNVLAPVPTPPATPRSGHSSVNGNVSSPAPPDFRERPCIDPDERIHSSDYYLGEAKTLKHEADKEANKTAQAMKYLDAALYFILTGHAMEQELLPAKTIFTLYKDSVDLIKFISSKFKSHQHISPSGSTDNKLAVLSLRCQSLLYLKMYNMKKGEFRDCQKTYAEYQKSTTASAGAANAPSLRPMPSPSVMPVSSSGAGSVGTVMATGPNGVVGWHPKTTGTPSPMSPLPSPAGSVGSVESQSSGFSSSSDLSGKVPNQHQGPPGMGTQVASSVGAQSAQQHQLTVNVPQTVFAAMRGQLGILNYLYHSNDLWEQADALIVRGRSQDFFSSLDRRCGCLTLHSSLRELVRYIRNGLHWLKGL